MRRNRLLLLVLALAACGDDAGPEEDFCLAAILPVTGGADAPTVVDVGLEVQPGEGIVVVATATDPQGSENLFDVTQSIGVFPDARCLGAPIVVEDDLAGSGIEETFGTAVSAAGSPDVYTAIAAAASWPVEVTFFDVDGNRTAGRVMARVIP